MIFLSPDDVREITGGRWLQRPAAGAAPLAGVSIDSRTIGAGEAFIVVRGERHDGHDYLGQAAERGAALLVVEDASRAGAVAVPAIEVGDAVGALAALARHWRRSLPGTRIVAITGSNGKTTTCRLVDAVLGASMPGIASPRSFNNHIGLPLTLLAARPQHRYAVCEVGSSNPGEIAALAAIAEPDVAVITSIGRAHLERFGGLPGVAAEKASLLRGLRPGGVAVVNADASLLRPLVDYPGRVVRFGRAPDAEFRLTAIEHLEQGAGTRFTVNGRSTFDIPLIGEHNAMNALAAVAVGGVVGLGDDAIREGLRRARPAEMRLQRSTHGPIEVFNDAYNANPDSMAAALTTLAHAAAGASRRVAVLGDMLELGAASREAHEEVGRRVASMLDIGLVVFVGPEAAAAARLARGAGAVETVHFESAGPPHAAAIASLLRPGDAVLLKASRSVGLERVEEAIARAWAGAPPAPTRR